MTSYLADHWGPTSRYAEVSVVNSTNADSNIKPLDDILSRHGFPETMRTDNGPPWNGNYTHKMNLKCCGIKHEPTRSLYDPEANGLTEAYMKVCQKVYHTALIEKKNPMAELNKRLRSDRSTLPEHGES